MVCLCICRVIVPLQLSYLHNQLSGLTILCFPLFFHYNWHFALYSILFVHGSGTYACTTAFVLDDWFD